MHSINFCRLTEKDCTGEMDEYAEYMVKCKLDKCSTPYIYECVDKLCTINTTECEEYKNLNILLNTNVFKSITQIPFMNEIKVKETKKMYEKVFKKFVGSIANCPKKKYTFKRADICIKPQVCYKRIENKAFLNIFRFSSQNKYNWRMVKCECPAGHSYRCGENDCTINQKACDASSLLMQLSFADWNKCPNK